MNIENSAPNLVILLSILLMTIFAFRSFALREIKFDGALVAPNLLTNRLYFPIQLEQVAQLSREAAGCVWPPLAGCRP
jgi:hypothetical protein